MEKEYEITIDGVQTVDGQKNNVSLFTLGQYHAGSDGVFRIVYKESSVTGFDGDETTLELDRDRTVSLTRRGKHNTHLLVQQSRRSACHYDLGDVAFSMAISEGTIVNNLGADGGTASFRYSLEVDAATLCENEITVSVRERKKRKAENQ